MEIYILCGENTDYADQGDGRWRAGDVTQASVTMYYGLVEDGKKGLLRLVADDPILTTR